MLRLIRNMKTHGSNDFSVSFLLDYLLHTRSSNLFWIYHCIQFDTGIKKGCRPQGRLRVAPWKKLRRSSSVIDILQMRPLRSRVSVTCPVAHSYVTAEPGPEPNPPRPQGRAPTHGHAQCPLGWWVSCRRDEWGEPLSSDPHCQLLRSRPPQLSARWTRLHTSSLIAFQLASHTILDSSKTQLSSHHPPSEKHCVGSPSSTRLRWISSLSTMPFTSDHPSLTLQTWRSPEIVLQPYTWAKPIRYSWLFLTLRLGAPFAGEAHTALTAPNPSIPPGQESLRDISPQARSPVESFMSPRWDWNGPPSCRFCASTSSSLYPMAIFPTVNNF